MKNKIPRSLRIWFLIHFIVDIAFAIPLILFPEQFLKYLGWVTIDTLTTRLIGAALLAIGGVSLLRNKSGLEGYHSLLTLKIIWSISAAIVLLISLTEGAPRIVWLFYVTFSIFALIWIYYKISLPKINQH